MKSNFFKSFSLMALSAVIFGLFSCEHPQPQPQPEEEEGVTSLEVKVNSTTQTTAEIGIKATLLDEIAYVVKTEQLESIFPAVVFATGTAVDPSAQTVSLKDLDANQSYWLYFAAKTKGEFYADVVELEVKTQDYSFDKMLTLVDTEYMGYKVRITVPDEVRNEPEKYAIRYNFGSLLDVLMAKYEMGRTWAVNLMENCHNCMGWQETVRDTTVYIHPYNENRLNEDGSTYIDPETGEPVMLHLPIAPAEPYLFEAGQYRYGHLDETGWGWSYGSEEKDWGYYIPMWDEAGWVAETGGFTQKDRKSVV